MANLYDNIYKLCRQKGVSLTIMCKESGASRGSLGDLKAGRKKSLSAETLGKIADYFGVSVDYILNGTKLPSTVAPTHDDAKVALFGGEGEVTDEMWEEVLTFVDYVKAKHKEREKKE